MWTQHVSRPCLQSLCFHCNTTASTVNLVCWCNERFASARGAPTGALSLPALFTVKLLSLSAFVSGASADRSDGISEPAVMDSRVQVIKTALCLRCLRFFFSAFPFRLGGSAFTAAHTVRPPEGRWGGGGSGGGGIYNWEEVQRQISGSYSHCTVSPPPLAVSPSRGVERAGLATVPVAS